MLPLVLYDIPSKLPGSSWSLNPAKTRFVLSYKNLPFETVWVEFPDIAPKLKEIEASSNKLPNGNEGYTVPVLSDPNTGALVTDSWVIAEYLDKTYPEKPVFPNGTKGLINAFDSALFSLIAPAFGFCLLRTSQVLSERSREYFVRTRGVFGDQVDEWSPEGPAREAQWAAIEKYHEAAKTWYERERGKVYRDDEWKRIASLHDGKWEKLLADVEKECNIA